jgi:hypothetical protein
MIIDQFKLICGLDPEIILLPDPLPPKGFFLHDPIDIIDMKQSKANRGCEMKQILVLMPFQPNPILNVLLSRLGG